MQLVEGFTSAFDSIYYRYHQAVRANIFKIVRDPEMTDDILQEVFISLWDRRTTFVNYKKISGWLFVSSYNHSLKAGALPKGYVVFALPASGK